MYKKVLNIFLILFLATQVACDCRDLTFDDCNAEKPFTSLKDTGTVYILKKQ